MAQTTYTLKYRAKDLDEYMGKKTVERVYNRFSTGDYPNVILLDGDRGSGKTTLARLMAKEMQCTHKINGKSCGVCPACRDVIEGLIYSDFGSSSYGVTEIDAATDNGKQAVEEVLDDAMNEPIGVNKKIIIFDEVHKVSNGGQNAMLKILEECPSYLVFILCTTEPDKLITPLRSRVQFEVKVRRADRQELTDKLMFICEQEKLTVSKDALDLICSIKQCNPRESIMLLENVAKNHNGKITRDNVLVECDEVDNGVYFKYFQSANKGIEEIMRFNASLDEKGIDRLDFMKGLTKFTMDCIGIKYGIGLDRISKDFLDNIGDFFKSYDSQDLDTLLQIIEYSRREIAADSSMAEIVVATTAMRIGKLKLLSRGLVNEQAEAVRENNKGSQLVREHRQEKIAEMNKVEESEIDSDLLQAVWGHNIAEVKGEVRIEDDSDHVELEGQAQDGMTEEELLKMFSI